ncbi:hypothetical protein BD324DRAFT_649990 [Kockovaella imperatae]|uniref:Uncharacterized protein n=1 Tax=Kockovaella imperatae TaxID=4999 RepID=A0A1Y1UKR0_9TREE|nr:hypothetical protein BD324DRAFT_649990 [Kockovaella imperatae]ORX38641.1 hypothetical protein BD324DRAFT_649990 [Kockovaella imperatae]
MTTAMMTSSSSALHAPSSAHCSRNPSPTSSPSLLPLASSMAKSSPSHSPLPAPRLLPSTTTTSSSMTPSSTYNSSAPSTSNSNGYDPSRLTPPASPQMISSRSFARAPPVRPYQSPLLSRSTTGGGKPLKPVEGDTRAFAEQVVHLFRQRTDHSRRGQSEYRPEPRDDQGRKRQGRSLGGSLSDTWDGEKVEFIVDIPVWSPGSFQDLSTLHALRDTTLSHTHTLIAYLQSVHSLPASYRLLARSAAPSSVPGSPRAVPTSRPVSPAPTHTHLTVGWGCIRLSPGLASPTMPKKELKPHVRRSSVVVGKSRSRSRSYSKQQPASSRSPKASMDVPEFRLDLDSAIIDEPEDEEYFKIQLKEGYRSGGSAAGSVNGSDDDLEEESADSIIAREVERRKVKEGSAFLMTLFGQPALILT